MSGERWRAIPGHPTFEISDRGAVRHARKGSVRHGAGPGGSPVVNLSDGRRSHGHPVAALVLRAFVGPKPRKKYRVHYRDGNPGNVRLSNLCWEPRARWDAAKIQRVARDRQRHADAITHGLAVALREKVSSMKEAGRLSGLARQTVMGAVRGDGRVNLSTLIQIAAGLGLRGSELLALAEKHAAVRELDAAE